MNDAVNSSVVSESAPVDLASTSEDVLVPVTPPAAPLASPPTTPVPKTVGAQLAIARMEQNLSIEQIAGQLKWSPRQIAEIEAGNYAVLPDLSTVRGFVRTYAKILKVNSQPLMDELPKEFAKLPVKVSERKVLDTPFPTGRMPWLGRQNNRLQWVLAGAFLLFLCFVACFVYRVELMQGFREIFPGNQQATSPVIVENSDGMKPDTQLVAPLSPPIVASATEQNSLPVSSAVTAVAPLAATTSASLSAGPVVPSVAVSAPAAVPVSGLHNEHTIALSPVNKAEPAKIELNKPPATKVEPTKPAQVQPGQTKIDTAKPEIHTPSVANEVKANLGSVSTSIAANGLTLSFKQDSWVQIKRVDGTLVVSQLYKAGTQETVVVTTPLTLVLGNAPGVEAKLRGQRLELTPLVGSNVVNLSIK